MIIYKKLIKPENLFKNLIRSHSKTDKLLNIQICELTVWKCIVGGLKQ